MKNLLLSMFFFWYTNNNRGGTMKYIKYIITVFFCMMAINVNATTSNFEPTINMEPDITENQIAIVVGYNGENIMALTQNIAYEKDYLTLLDVTSMDNFVVTKGNEKQEGNFKTLKLLADSNYAFEDINYAILTFEVKSNFKVGKSSKIFMYNYESMGPKKDKYRHKGYEMTLRRDEVGQMTFLLKVIDSSTKRDYWLSQNYLIIIGIVLVLVAIIATIFLIPTKRKREARAEKIRAELNASTQAKETKNIDPIKIDYDMIENLGTVNNEVDMREAIQVSDLKPFGEAEGKTMYAKTNASSQEEPSMQQPIPKPEVPKEINPSIDAFNMTIESKSNENVMQTVQNQEVSQVNNEGQVISNGNNGLESTADTKKINQYEERQKNSEEKDEDLIVFQPTFEDENGTDNNGSNNIQNMSFILLLLLSVSLLIPNVKALEYRVSELRDCIVGNIPYNSELDYNHDGIVDLADIIETKDLTNTTLETDLPNYNFKPVESEGVHITEPTTTITTTTTNRTFNINTTQKRTTTEKSVTTKTTATKSTKTTTVKTTAQTYTVTITNTHSSADKKSVSVLSGKTAVFKITPDVGYTYDSVSCSNGANVTYGKISNKLEVKNVISDTTCTINFKERDDMKVTVSASHGKVSPATIKGDYKSSVSTKVTPSTGYIYKSHSCTNGLVATYDASSNTLTIKSLINDGSCKVIFEEMTYQMTVKALGIEKKFTAKYNQKTDFTIEVNKTFAKLKCNGLTKNFTMEDQGSGKYIYTFNYVMTKDTVCEYS